MAGSLTETDLNNPPSDPTARGIPEITPELRAAAKRQPNGWVYVIHPDIDPDGKVPPDAIQGAFAVGPDGELTGEYKANPNYAGDVD